MELPLAYINEMKALLGAEYEEYLASFEEVRLYGLRANTLKISPAKLAEKGEFSLSPVPWCESGFYYAEGERPAKHPYYHAGLYYLQEPSAMTPGAMIPIEEGDFVLDICAAPGGKTTQLAARLGGTGLLISNDISAGRAKALLKNVEISGITNAIVMSEPPKKLAERFGGFFDKILIDAPCSGEGMFRKEPDMVKSWNEELLTFCREQQADILEHCASMLKTGGMILYSTCTFAKMENEDSIQTFLDNHPEFTLVPLEKNWGFVPGCEPLMECVRLYPHKIKGEGHFLALLQKTGEPTGCSTPTEASIGEKELEPFRQFAKETLTGKWKGTFQIYGDSLCLLPEGAPATKGLRVLRSGWQLGTLKKGRFEPSQAFAMGLKKEEVKNVLDMPLSDERVIRYLKGETLEAPEAKDGWTLVCVDGYPLGWGKTQKGRLKNKYAVGWKWE